ncbi:FolC bifunctional protein [Coriobacterium glomerans PW2]|uniref:tetrahydrofolate synthase n=1 Tax=Coriobacterium glomerans (strain ATCC 49209 / DSM 20642 / JCM 10262 / PW2) TaxID=700015 RepID=F2N7N2_CORGP|nr:Mur ligase family protein [Coriobacterium glomerans]AEB06924.1 FolC bifunctional protein [Coriobacterium glomerans PW2]
MSASIAPDEESARYEIPFRVPKLSYEQARARAADTGRISSGATPLLETVVDMLEMLERPDRHLACLQIAGTNGKTSTARFSAAILAGEGKRAALYTSPELVRVPERMEVCGSVVSDDMFAHGVSAAVEAGRRVNAARSAANKQEYVITPFDLLTVAALVIFALEAVDVAVLEVGLGGRWDATSATDPVAVAITGIGLDHMGILGDTLAEIAAEKAAVVKPGRICVLGEGTHEASVERVMDERCRSCGVEPLIANHELLHAPEHLGDSVAFSTRTARFLYRVKMPKPIYQAQNAATAIMLVEAYLGRQLDGERLESSLASCPTPGRFDLIRSHPLLLVDACHNPQSCEVFVSALDAIEADKRCRPTLLIAALSDKDVEGVAAALIPAFPRVAVTQTKSSRAVRASDLARIVRCELERENRDEHDLIGVFPTVRHALRALSDSASSVVAAGTITLAGEVAGIARR